MRSILKPLLPLAALLVLAAPLDAQRPTSHPGLWIGAGVGLGWARVSCRICGANRGHSLSATAQIGGRLSNSVLIGGEIEGWFRNSNASQNRPADELLLAYGAVVYWYPSPRYPYFLRAGLGLVTYRIDDGTDRLTSSALGPKLGIGYELHVAGHLSLVPYLNMLVGSTGAEVKFNGSQLLDQASIGLLQFGIGIAHR
jgi:hypothetical protein